MPLLYNQSATTHERAGASAANHALTISRSGTGQTAGGTRPPSVPDYELIRRIGGGAYGDVWLARSTTGVLRAVKIVWRHTFEDERPFQREFEGIQRFERLSHEHPNQLALFHVGRNEAAGCFYYMMELADALERIDGLMDNGIVGEKPAHQSSNPTIHSSNSYQPHTLRADLGNGRLPATRVVEIGLALTEALAHLHTNGLVHRDVKPSNVIFVNGRPKLADIGLVTDAGDTRSIVGTEGYLAPEGPGTPQADLFALGKVLYEAATGQDRCQLPQLPPDLRDWSDANLVFEVNEILLRACARDTRQRYQSAQEMHADLELLQRGESVKARRSEQRRWGFVKKYGFATAAVSLLVAGGWQLSSRFGVPRTQRVDAPSSPGLSSVEARFVAVLPFDNESPDQADEYLGLSIADELSSALAKIPALRVLGRDSAAALKSTKDRRAAAQQLKVGTVLAGHLRKSANQLRLTAQLINAADDSLLWSEVYDREMREIFGIQTDLAEKVADRLNVKLSDTVRQRLALKPTRNLEAYQLYLEGRYFWNRRPNADAARAIQLFQQAIQKDSNYAAAYSGLADSYSYGYGISNYLAFMQSWSTAKLNAGKAVALDDTLSEAHASLGYVRENFDWDWAGADTEFRRALELDPNNVTARSWYAIHLGRLGQYEPAIQEARRAQELDSLSPMRSRILAWMLLASRKHDEAIQEYEKSLQLGPGRHARHSVWDSCYFYAGKYEEALDAFEKGAQASGLAPQKALLRYAALRQAYRTSGSNGYWQKELELTKAEWQEPGDAAEIAILYAWLGDKEQTLAWLEKASAQRANLLMNLNLVPVYDLVRSEPRYQAVLKKMGLPEPVWKQ